MRMQALLKKGAEEEQHMASSSSPSSPSRETEPSPQLPLLDENSKDKSLWRSPSASQLGRRASARAAVSPRRRSTSCFIKSDPPALAESSPSGYNEARKKLTERIERRRSRREARDPFLMSQPLGLQADSTASPSSAADGPMSEGMTGEGSLQARAG